MRIARVTLVLVLLIDAGWLPDTVAANESTDGLAGRFEEVQPLLARYCLDCHSQASREGELDLEQFGELADVKRKPEIWKQVVTMLGDAEMPPDGSPQPTPSEQQLLLQFGQLVVDEAIRARAGDPGQVTLRRLNNAEYTYTIQDLTGVALDPAREFPVDGAAGEGFTNTGDAQAMSPALFQKYLDAGRQIADHAVLLPDGFRFSVSATRRDWADEIVAKIRLLYARHTSGESDTSILNGWGADPSRSTANDGRVDLEGYFTALLEHRQRLLDGSADLSSIAAQHQLNEKYLDQLARMLCAEQSASWLLDDLRRRWRSAEPSAGADLAKMVRAWQDRLWGFRSVGHLGLIRSWQHALHPATESLALRRRFAAANDPHIVQVPLAVRAAGPATDQPLNVLLHRPRLEFENRPAILLRDVAEVAARIEHWQALELPRVTEYLAALQAWHRQQGSLAAIATELQLDAAVLQRWADYSGVGRAADRNLTGHLTRKLTNVSGYEALNGWAADDLPSLLTNRSSETLRFSTLTVPGRAVTVHPTPDQEAIIVWKSPVDGRVRMRGSLADADANCGNGIAWRVELRNAIGTSQLAAGHSDNGVTASFEVAEDIVVHSGDNLYLVVNARDRNHVCDTTRVELTIQAVDPEHVGKQWDLARDIVDDVHAGNPHADGYGNPETWHFLASGGQQPVSIPSGSALARWKAMLSESHPQSQQLQLAEEVHRVFAAETKAESLSPADQALRGEVRDWHGPFGWIELARSHRPRAFSSRLPAEIYGIDFRRFGRHPAGLPLDEASYVVAAPADLVIELPKQLAAGAELVADVSMVTPVEEPAGVQVGGLESAPPSDRGLLAGVPILTASGNPGTQQIHKAYDAFRQLFPAAMCHARIVPVDEVVTLVLYHREDEPLVRLMLTEDEAAELDRLWDELRFVSQDALRLEVALEQILEFATQDADPKVFDPVREPIAQGAVAFRQKLVEAEPAQLAALLRFADLVYRRPASPSEQQGLKELYNELRQQGLAHEQAFRLTLARLLSSPPFLYRLEQPAAADAPQPVSNWELANRLSYFLWSSMPDAELRQLAATGQLHAPGQLAEQTARMLADPRSRRLAIEFACQWLHIRDFDQHDEKSERYFPEFAGLRDDMYLESVYFFEDLFRHDRSILEILDSDATYLNQTLAEHYGIPGVAGEEWRRVEGVRRFGRGGVLGQASTLARQSGASRTSPILRGNWVAETLLGERLPRPPKDVPLLPDDGESVDGLTVRQLVERHTADAACAGCHQRIDPYGFALERFDAIGLVRQGLPAESAADTQTTLMDGTQIDGEFGLREYLRNDRRQTFVRQFCRKLLGFGLGRSVLLSDEPLLDEMNQALQDNGYRVSLAIQAVVASPQFQKIRGAGELVDSQATAR